MFNLVKKFSQLSLLVILALFSRNAFSKNCGFTLKDVAPQKIDGGVPIYVDRQSFSDDILKHLRARAAAAKAKLDTQTGSCPATQSYVSKVANKLIKNSGLSFVLSGKDQLETIVLCGKTRMAPVARLMAGKYLVVPAALPLQAETEDAMAAVLAHEIAHYTLSHHARFLAKTKGRAPAKPKFWTSRLSAVRKTHENEADSAGLKLLSNAGYNTSSAIEHLDTVHRMALQRKRVLASLRPSNESMSSSPSKTHPAAEQRKGLLASQIRSCGYKASSSTADQGLNIPI